VPLLFFAQAKAEQKRIQGEMKTLGECSVPQLKDVLRLNKQPVGGTPGAPEGCGC